MVILGQRLMKISMKCKWAHKCVGDMKDSCVLVCQACWAENNKDETSLHQNTHQMRKVLSSIKNAWRQNSSTSALVGIKALSPYLCKIQKQHCENTTVSKKIGTGPQPRRELTIKTHLAWQSGPPQVSRFPPQSRSPGQGPVSSPPGGAQGLPHPSEPLPGSCSGTLGWKTQERRKMVKKRSSHLKVAEEIKFLALYPHPDWPTISNQIVLLQDYK